jgi:hypothetical protein
VQVDYCDAEAVPPEVKEEGIRRVGRVCRIV